MTPSTGLQGISQLVAVNRQANPYYSGHDRNNASRESLCQPSITGICIQVGVEGADVASPVEGEGINKRTSKGEELEDMVKEFEEMIKKFSEINGTTTCSRCHLRIDGSDYHYACQVCVKTSWRMCVCQKCGEFSKICLTHGGEMFKRADKPWCAVYGWSPYIDPKVTEIDDDMTRALKEKDIVAIRQYAQNSQLLNAHGHLGYTPLHVAAHLGLEEGAKILLECGALRESREYQNYTPLLTAIERNQTRMVMLLLDSGASVNSLCGIDSSKALHHAAANGMWHMVTILLKHGAAVDALSGLGTPLQLSAWVGSVKCAEALLAAGANPNAKCEKVLLSALGTAAFVGYRKVVEVLLEYGASVNQADGVGQTPLIRAAKQGHFDICKDLLDHHADTNAQCASGFNAVVRAAQRGDERIVNLLLERGASGIPPRALSGKWKRLAFDANVRWSTRESILRTLRAAKYA
jgi:ankyrin repeat protein